MTDIANPNSNATAPEQRENPQASCDRPSKAVVIASWIAVAIMLAFIFYMSSKTGNDIDHNAGIFSEVKAWLSAQAIALTGHEVDVSPVGHFCEYLALGAALANALRFHLKPEGAAGALLTAHPTDALSKWAPLIAAGLSSVYGMTDEFHQIFTPGRSCDPMDWLVDTIAAALGALICYAVLKKVRK